MGFFELDDVFGYQDANAIKKLWPGTEPPYAPGVDEVWLDTGMMPPQLKRYLGNDQWRIIGGMTDNGNCVDISLSDLNDLSQTGMYMGETVTNAPSTAAYYFLVFRQSDTWVMQLAYSIDLSNGLWIRVNKNDDWAGGWKKVWFESGDGSGSGLDADQLDGIEGASYMRSDADQDVSAHTRWLDNQQARFGSDTDLTIQHTGDNALIDNYTGGMFFQQKSHGHNMYFRAENAAGETKTLLTLDPDAGGPGSVCLNNPAGSLYIGENNDIQIYHDGTGAHIKNQYTGGLSFWSEPNGANIRFYGNNDAGETKLMLRLDPGNHTIYFGDDQGLCLYNDGTQTQLQTLTTALCIRSFAQGENIKFNLDDATGVTQTVMLLDPDAQEVLVMGNKVWHAGNDGSGSTLNADTLDDLHASSFIRSDADDTITGCITSNITSGSAINFDGGHSRITVHDGYGNFNIKSGVNDSHIIDSGYDGGSHIELAHNGAISLAVSAAVEGNPFTDDVAVYITTSGISLKGDVTVSDQLVIPTNQPSSLINGSIWIV